MIGATVKVTPIMTKSLKTRFWVKLQLYPALPRGNKFLATCSGYKTRAKSVWKKTCDQIFWQLRIWLEFATPINYFGLRWQDWYTVSAEVVVAVVVVVVVVDVNVVVVAVVVVVVTGLPWVNIFFWPTLSCWIQLGKVFFLFEKVQQHLDHVSSQSNSYQFGFWPATYTNL